MTEKKLQKALCEFCFDLQNESEVEFNRMCNSVCMCKSGRKFIKKLKDNMEFCEKEKLRIGITEQDLTEIILKIFPADTDERKCFAYNFSLKHFILELIQSAKELGLIKQKSLNQQIKELTKEIFDDEILSNFDNSEQTKRIKLKQLIDKLED